MAKGGDGMETDQRQVQEAKGPGPERGRERDEGIETKKRAAADNSGTQNGANARHREPGNAPGSLRSRRGVVEGAEMPTQSHPRSARARARVVSESGCSPLEESPERNKGREGSLDGPVPAETVWEGEGGSLGSAPRLRRPLRVLLVGHQFQVPSEGQAKAAALAGLGDLHLEAITPERYREAEVRWRFPIAPVSNRYRFHVEKVVLPWAGPAKWYLQWYPDLPRTLCEFRPDIIDIWEEPWSLLSVEICWLRDKLLPNARLISETEQNINRTLPPPFEWFRSYTFRKADFLVARNSEAIRVARSKGYRGPARVVGNGVDLELFRPRDRDACRKLFGIHGFAVGYAGRLVPEKGLLDLVRAVERMPQDVSLWVSGDGPLRESLQQNGSRNRWVGALPREKLPEFLSALDVLVLPSHTTARWKEQFGRVLVEAQACEIPVIGANSGAIPEVIGEAGILFEEGDTSALLRALEHLYEEPQLRIQLARKGRAQVELQYGWESIACQMRDIYRELEPSGSRREFAENVETVRK